MMFYFWKYFRILKFYSKSMIVSIYRPLIVAYLRRKLNLRHEEFQGKRIAIYTAIFGDYDTLKPIKKQSIDVDWICFSDKQQFLEGWTCIVKTLGTEDPRKAAKWFKVCPSNVSELLPYDYLIYIDGSAEILSYDFAAIALKKTNTLGLYAHPERSSIQAEASYCKNMQKYNDIDLVSQMLEYTKVMPSDDQLWAGGVIVRKKKTENFDDIWWQENCKSLKDQISLPYALYKANIDPSTMPGSHYGHIFIRFNVLHRLKEYHVQK
jgi:hypothetical protein